MSQVDKRTESAGRVDASKSEERRARILDALRRCILRKGYSATSFNELAQETGMSPSHVFYYFRGKDAVLQELYRDAAQRLVASVATHRGEPPQEQFQTMADYAFSGEVFSHEERLVFSELIGQSMHNPSIKDIRDELTTAIVQYLTDVFASCSRPRGVSAEDAGLVAAALGTGLVIYSCCGLLTPSHAQRLLHGALSEIGGSD